MRDDCRQIEERIVVAGVLPVEEARPGRVDDVLDDEVVVTEAQVGPMFLLM